MTTTGTQAVASDSGARPFATVNPYTGETVREFPFLDSGQIPDVVGRAATAFQSWRERPVADRARMALLGVIAPHLAPDLAGEDGEGQDVWSWLATGRSCRRGHFGAPESESVLPRWFWWRAA
jgi:hypothetical protein